MANAIVFDLGAVLFRWDPRLLLKQVFAHRSPTEPQITQWLADIFDGLSPNAEWSQFDRGLIEVPQLIQKIAARTGIDSADIDRMVHAIPEHLQPMPGTIALIDALKQAGHDLYFLSNMPIPYARHLVQMNDFAAWFRDGIFSADVQMIKPEPGIFHLAERRWNLNRPVFIDDSLKNIETASALGWRTIHFASAAQVGQELTAMRLLA